MTNTRKSEYDSVNEGLEEMRNVELVNDYRKHTEIILKESENISIALTRIPFTIHFLEECNGEDKMKLNCSTRDRLIDVVVPTGGDLQ